MENSEIGMHAMREREREFVTVSADSAHRAAFDSVKKGKEKKNGKS